MRRIVNLYDMGWMQCNQTRELITQASETCAPPTHRKIHHTSYCNSVALNFSPPPVASQSGALCVKRAAR